MLLNNSFKLNEVKSFTIHCSPAKSNVLSRQKLLSKLDNNDKKERNDDIVIAAESTEVKLSRKDWRKMVVDMKEKLYKNKPKITD